MTRSDAHSPDRARGEKNLISWSSAAAAAVVTALALVNVAHDGFGLTREEILTRSLTAAAVIGLALATYYFGEKRRKPRDR